MEVWHRILKSGWRIEACQLASGERLQRCLTMHSVIAWRIFYATMLARAVPALPCSVLLDLPVGPAATAAQRARGASGRWCGVGNRAGSGGGRWKRPFIFPILTPPDLPWHANLVHTPQHASAGRCFQTCVACSKAYASCNTPISSWWRPTICTPTGRPSGVKPHGTEIAGCPVMVM